MANKRNFGVDLLRIVSMFFVLILHIINKGGVYSNLEVFSTKYEICRFFECMTYCCINCYALISGYVCIDSKYKITNFVMIWLKVVFYSLIITIVFKFTFPSSVSVSTFIKIFIPTMTREYWYLTSYFSLFIFIPIINKGVNSLNKKQSRYFIIVLFIFISLLNTLFGENLDTFGGYSSFWLIIVYTIGALIKKTEINKEYNLKKSLLLYGVCVIFTWLWMFSFSRLHLFDESYGYFSKLFFKRPHMFCEYTSPTMLLAAFFLFSAFSNIEFKSKVGLMIKRVSKCSFSVYIIHAHPLMWENVIDGAFAFVGNYTWILMMVLILAIASAIFIICVLIDMVREGIFEYFKIYDLVYSLEKRVFNDLWQEN